ncbi:MAG: 16S rRNA (cytosine(1402)-N(4))-methyltransferase RsmH [Patescibacteria group bacterium]
MHTPVLLNETIEILNPQPGEFFIDGTIGSGGHAAEIFKRISPNGMLLGIDWDKAMIENVRQKISAISNFQFLISKLILKNNNYANLPEILKNEKFGKADGLLIDLGFSSEQLDPPAGGGRGFSFQKDEILDMRYSANNDNDDDNGITAAEVVNSFSEKDLADIIYKYGEERFSRRIAKKIVEERRKKRIITTFELAEIVNRAVPGRGRLNPATKTFQALRIYVNKELENLETLLKNLYNIIKPKGRVAIISFHSLEDRLIKNYFRDMAKQGKAEILTKKPIRPTFEEIQINPRSRSAKLRAIILNI